MLNAVTIIEKGLPIYMTSGVKGALQQILDGLLANGPKDDPRVYGQISALDLLLHHDLPPVADLIDIVAPDKGLNDEEFWSDYFKRDP